MAETAAAKAGGVADNPLGTAPIPQLLFKYAPPAILSMMVTALYNIIDTFFVGHGVGEDGIAATPLRPFAWARASTRWPSARWRTPCSCLSWCRSC